MGSKIENGARALLAGLALTATGAGLGCKPTVTPEVSPEPTPVVEDISSQVEAQIAAIKAKYGIEISAENLNIGQELEIISQTLGKIPASGYLASGGIGIHKDSEPIRTGGMMGAIPFFDDVNDRYGLNIILAADFLPSAQAAREKRPVYQTHQEQLEYVLAYGLGHSFARKVYPEQVQSYKTADEREKNIANNPLYSTFSRIVGYELRKEKVRVLKATIGENGRIIIEEDKEEEIFGWYPMPVVWGAHSKFFISPSHRGIIDEEFADYFAAAVLHPEWLSQRARDYFAPILSGLRENPQLFVKQVRRNPQTLPVFPYWPDSTE